MTSSEMQTRLRSMLDEDSNQFWDDDTELYPFLTDGQTEAFKLLLKKNPKDVRLDVLQKAASGTADAYIDIPSDMWDNNILTAYWNSVYCDIRLFDKTLQYLKSNSYKAPVTQRPITYIIPASSKIFFEPSGSSIAYSLTYFSKPTDISSSVEPIISSNLHYAVILFAFSSLLKKAKLFDRADAELKNFIGLVGNAG